MKILYIILILILLISFFGCTKKNKENVCPDEWYVDETPQVCDSPPCDYPQGNVFFINGEILVPSESYADWVKENCDSIKPNILA